MTKKILNNSFFLRKLLNFLYYIFYLFILLIFFEVLIRILVFFPTNSDVFKYGFKKSVIFEIVDLSKFQITIVDTDRKFVKSKQTGKKKFGFLEGLLQLVITVKEANHHHGLIN